MVFCFVFVFGEVKVVWASRAKWSSLSSESGAACLRRMVATSVVKCEGAVAAGDTFGPTKQGFLSGGVFALGACPSNLPSDVGPFPHNGMTGSFRAHRPYP